RIWMQQGENTTFLRYTLVEADSPIDLELKVLVNYRDFHGATHAGHGPNEWQMKIGPADRGVQIVAFDGAAPFYLRSAQAEYEPRHIWYRDFFFSLERERGLEDREDHLFAAVFRAPLAEGQSVNLIFSTEADASLDGETALVEERSRQSGVAAAEPIQ